MHCHCVPMKALPDTVTQKEQGGDGEVATALASVSFCCLTVVPGVILDLRLGSAHQDSVRSPMLMISILFNWRVLVYEVN